MGVCEFCEQATPLPARSHCAGKACQAAAAWQRRALLESERNEQLARRRWRRWRLVRPSEQMIEAGVLVLRAHGYDDGELDEVVRDVLHEALRAA